MKSIFPTDFQRIVTDSFLRGVAAATLLILTAGPQGIAAEVPHQSGPAIQLGGIYKVSASNDPWFDLSGSTEYFIDFGRGAGSDRRSGTLTISMRRNPNVKVRIMAWEYDAAGGKLMVGGPCAEGSRKAVALAIWNVRYVSRALVLDREGRRVVLRRADPGDY